ncbi:transcription factor MYB1R1-like [Cynara cardunculus var. scolymus]|uniref:transcription factor MYB1R1-like n=1 Tax=Cynara cardunculus var. scolymus TaxID=59895 RepID=UPI000D62A7E9|nr:transcription factor MYB1R1-like [Cynara cardunculus var. scolymus]
MLQSQSQSQSPSQSQSRCCSQCGTNGHNSRTCSSAADDSSSDGSGIGAGEIMLFGVRVKVDPMRKSVSMNNLSQYEQPATRESSNNNIDVAAVAAVAADTGYASADDAVRNQSNGSRERKRGVPWTEDEHKLFLLGLQKVGKGDWRGISRNFVKTRTPTQVASHAQKYFLRRSNLNRRRRRSSLFDITTDSVPAVSTEEQQVPEDNKGQDLLQPSLQQISPRNGFPTTTFPVAVGSVLPPVQLANVDQDTSESMLLGRPNPMFPTPNPSTMVDLNLNKRYETDPLPLSLNLSLSFGHNQSSQRRSSPYLSGFTTGDGMVRVA